MSRGIVDVAAAAAVAVAVVAATPSDGTDRGTRHTDNDDVDDRCDMTVALAIGERIRAALECPICLLLNTEPTCCCPNGHVICNTCLTRLRDMDNAHRCPMCRSPMAVGTRMSCTAVKLAELTVWLRVPCSHRQYGCDELVPVYAVSGHESTCTYMPDAMCHVSTCQWVGMVRCLFEHVSQMHPASAVRSKTNYLIVNDVKDIISNNKRSYLVETTDGLFWVMLSYLTRNRIKTSVLMVHDSDCDEHYLQRSGPPGMVFRVSWTDFNGTKKKARCRIRRITWSRSALYEKTDETYTTVRCNKGRLQIVWYDRYAQNRGNQRPQTPTAESFNSTTT